MVLFPVTGGSGDPINVNLKAQYGESMFEDVSVIEVSGIPREPSWALQPLYRQKKVTPNALDVKYTVWQVMFNSNDNHLHMISGTFGGQPVHHARPIEPKAGRDMVRQAILEALAMYKNHKHDGYHTAYEEPPRNAKPMLANKYPDKKIQKWPVAVDAKLDGMRCLASLNPSEKEGVQLSSRSARDISWLEHIRRDIKEYLEFLPDGTFLDGELYSPVLNFNQIISIIRTTNTKHPENERIQYYIYDVILPSPTVVEDRNNILIQAYINYREDRLSNNLNIPRTFLLMPKFMAFSEKDINYYHELFVSMGNEGTMIRKFAGVCVDNPYSIEIVDPIKGDIISSYWCKLGNRTEKSIQESLYIERRTNNLLKLKDFTDEEGIVVDMEQGVGFEDGAAVMKIFDMRGNIFMARPRGSHEERREMYSKYLQENIQVYIEPKIGSNLETRFTFYYPDGTSTVVFSNNAMQSLNDFAQVKSEYLGKMYTYRYQNLTPDGIPRIPSGVGFRYDL